MEEEELSNEVSGEKNSNQKIQITNENKIKLNNKLEVQLKQTKNLDKKNPKKGLRELKCL